jgi:hypothetical protein
MSLGQQGGPDHSDQTSYRVHDRDNLWTFEDVVNSGPASKF